MIVVAVLLVVLIGVVQWRAARHEARAMAAHPPIGKIIEVDGIPVHAKVMGQGPDLVLIHGASGNMNDFTMGFAARMAERYRVILFDRPGLGWTGRLPGSGGTWNNTEETPQAQAVLLQKAADQLGVKSPILLGHSYGGIVAVAWGLARPADTAALVLVGSVSEPWPGGLGWIYALTGSRIGGALFVPLATAFISDRYINNNIGSIFEPQEAPAGYGAHLGVGLTLRRMSLRANAQQVNALRPHVVEMQKSYGTLRMPIEMVHGDTDTIVPAHVHAQVLINEVPNGALTLLPGQGHMLQHTAPDAVVAAIDRAAARAGLR